jgi:hypothetical protein
MKQESIKLEELPENCQVIEVPDDVYVSSTGKYYYPEPTTKAKIKMDLQIAEDKGIKPSKSYLKFLEKLSEEQK